MDIHGAKNILARGQGIGRCSASGRVVIAKNAEEALLKVKGGEILVTIGSDREMVPAIEKCCALVAEEGGLTSHAAIVGLNLGIPVLVGMTNVTALLKDGQEVTVDAENGVIYNIITGEI